MLPPIIGANKPALGVARPGSTLPATQVGAAYGNPFTGWSPPSTPVVTPTPCTTNPPIVVAGPTPIGTDPFAKKPPFVRPVPEPSTYALLILGLVGIAITRRRKPSTLTA